MTVHPAAVVDYGELNLLMVLLFLPLRSLVSVHFG
jgi:hypothetical protein